MAKTTLSDQTKSLIYDYGLARVLDARRPKFGHDLQPVSAEQVQESRGVLGYVTALVGVGLLVAGD